MAKEKTRRRHTEDAIREIIGGINEKVRELRDAALADSAANERAERLIRQYRDALECFWKRFDEVAAAFNETKNFDFGALLGAAQEAEHDLRRLAVLHDAYLADTAPRLTPEDAAPAAEPAGKTGDAGGEPAAAPADATAAAPAEAKQTLRNLMAAPAAEDDGADIPAFLRQRVA